MENLPLEITSAERFFYGDHLILLEGAIEEFLSCLQMIRRYQVSRGQRDPIASFQARIKSAESMRAKLERQNRPVTADSALQDVWDAAGVRLIDRALRHVEHAHDNVPGVRVIIGNTSIDMAAVRPDMEAQLEAMDLGPLFGLWFQSMFVGITMWALTICIFIITYGRMIEVYLVTSVAPIPMAAMMGKEFGGMGQNYLKSLFALGFQAFLIMICVGIYAVLVQSIAPSGNISAAIWTCMGYTVLLCFTLFKTGSLAKSVFSAH